jgi:hypothetical protein
VLSTGAQHLIIQEGTEECSFLGSLLFVTDAFRHSTTSKHPFRAPSFLSVNHLPKLLSSFEACLDYDLEPDYYSASAISDRGAPFINSRRTHLTYTSERKVTLLLAACASRESQQRCGAAFGST